MSTVAVHPWLPLFCQSDTHLHNLFKTASCECVCLSPTVCRCVYVGKKAIILNQYELNATVTLTSAPLFRVWLSHTLPTLVYIQWMGVAMNANPMSAIFIKFQTQSNISQPLSVPHRRPSSLPVFLLWTSVCKIIPLTFLTNFSFRSPSLSHYVSALT